MKMRRTPTYRSQPGFESNVMTHGITCHNGNHVFTRRDEDGVWHCGFCTATSTRDAHVITPGTRLADR